MQLIRSLENQTWRIMRQRATEAHAGKKKVSNIHGASNMDQALWLVWPMCHVALFIST